MCLHELKKKKACISAGRGIRGKEKENIGSQTIFYLLFMTIPQSLSMLYFELLAHFFYYLCWEAC